MCLDAQRQFHYTKRSAVKCITGFNHNRERHRIINRNLPSVAYPRCGEKEMWGYAVQCRALDNVSKGFINELTKQIKALVRKNERR